MNTLFNKKNWLRSWCNRNVNRLKESFEIEINNKWLSLTGVALFWET